VRSWIALAVVWVPLAAQAAPGGVTVEAGLGPGFVRTGPSEFPRYDSVTLGGSVAVGAWLSPRTALTGRVVLQTYGVVSGDDSDDYRYWFVGPSVQHWLTDWAWISGGAGLAVYQRAADGGSFGSSAGIAADLRAGIAVDPLGSSRHRLEAWLELLPATYRYTEVANPPPPAEWRSFASATVNLGYQFR
jgi:hypothetical protein